MVTSIAFLFMWVTLGLSFIVPIIVLIVLLKKQKGAFGIWVAGALGFFVPQMLIRIPILQVMGTWPVFINFSKQYPYIFVLLLALTAGLFETAGRFAALKAVSKRLSYGTAVTAGIGHGSIEAIMLVGLTYVNNLIFSYFINAGRISMLLPTEEMQQSVTKLIIDTPPNLYLMAGLERLMTMVFHAAMTVLLTLLILKGRSLFGFILVTLLHFLTDFLTGVLQILKVNAWGIEAMILVIALLSLLLIFKIKPLFGQEQNIPPDPGEKAVEEGF